MADTSTAVERAQARGWWATYGNLATIPFWGVHVGAVIGVCYLGWDWRGMALAIGLYYARMFFVCAGYHRYFSHRSFKTSRVFQFLLGLGASTTSQKGVLWWAAHHRVHHKHSDLPGDLHSVKQSGFWWSHMGWILARDLEGTDLSGIKDFARYPELRWLDKLWFIPTVGFAVVTFLIGGLWGLVWAFAVSQVLLWHGTFTINSLAHLIGKRRYETTDTSKNHWLLALITMGEGWHNNHHHYQVSVRQGFRWWEVDLAFYVLRLFSLVGLVWDLHGVPPHIVENRAKDRVAEPVA